MSQKKKILKKEIDSPVLIDVVYLHMYFENGVIKALNNYENLATELKLNKYARRAEDYIKALETLYFALFTNPENLIFKYAISISVHLGKLEFKLDYYRLLKENPGLSDYLNLKFDEILGDEANRYKFIINTFCDGKVKNKITIKAFLEGRVSF